MAWHLHPLPKSKMPSLNGKYGRSGAARLISGSILGPSFGLPGPPSAPPRCASCSLRCCPGQECTLHLHRNVGLAAWNIVRIPVPHSNVEMPWSAVSKATELLNLKRMTVAFFARNSKHAWAQALPGHLARKTLWHCLKGGCHSTMP